MGFLLCRLKNTFRSTYRYQLLFRLTFKNSTLETILGFSFQSVFVSAYGARNISITEAGNVRSRDFIFTVIYNLKN